MHQDPTEREPSPNQVYWVERHLSFRYHLFGIIKDDYSRYGRNLDFSEKAHYKPAFFRFCSSIKQKFVAKISHAQKCSDKWPLISSARMVRLGGDTA